MQLSLDKNPIAWLQQFSWKHRIIKWGLCLAFVVVLCEAPIFKIEIADLAGWLLPVLAVTMTFSGINGFLEEKRSGALELILVTPLSVNQIILGRVQGLWKQFLPAALVLVALDTGNFWVDFLYRMLSQPLEAWNFRQHILNWFSNQEDRYIPIRLVLICVFLVLPFCATYFALRVKNLIVAAMLTWIALGIPPFLALNFSYLVGVSNSAFVFMLLLSSFGLIWVVTFLLDHSLSRRIYSF
jgi:hypothetical protein